MLESTGTGIGYDLRVNISVPEGVFFLQASNSLLVMFVSVQPVTTRAILLCL
jgi:hypothetical protein